MMIQTQNKNKGNTKYRAERIRELSKVKVRIVVRIVNCICIHVSEIDLL